MPYPYGFNTGYYTQPGYQNTYPQIQYTPPTPQIPQPIAQQPSGIIWVQGEAGAKSYMVAQGNTVPLWDSENQVIYIKSVDAGGMPSMRIIDYTERTSAPSQAKAPGNEYVTRKEFEEAMASLRCDSVSQEVQQ